jgi:hypothetical protein
MEKKFYSAHAAIERWKQASERAVFVFNKQSGAIFCPRRHCDVHTELKVLPDTSGPIAQSKYGFSQLNLISACNTWNVGWNIMLVNVR